MLFFWPNQVKLFAFVEESAGKMTDFGVFLLKSFYDTDNRWIYHNNVPNYRFMCEIFKTIIY